MTAEVLYCTGCGRRSDNPLPLTARSCCPDSHYVTADEAIRDLWTLITNGGNHGHTEARPTPGNAASADGLEPAGGDATLPPDAQ